jgi:hypothetical protein
VDKVVAEAGAPSGSCGEVVQAQRSQTNEMVMKPMIFIQAYVDDGVWSDACGTTANNRGQRACPIFCVNGVSFIHS